MTQNKENVSRRNFLRSTAWASCMVGIAGLVGALLGKSSKANMVWQIDPKKCIACGNCATFCVLEQSAVKCVHAYALCGYCNICTGYLDPKSTAIDTGAENELCPTGAIKRTFIEDPYYEYTIDESLCIGCGKCVKGCNAFGNGSLFLQILHDRCVNCNECSIAVACPSGAISRISADRPYLLKGGNQH